MERGEGFDSIRDLRAGIPRAGKDAHEQLSAGRVIIGYQDSLSRFLLHLPSVIRKESAAKLYFSSCGIETIGELELAVVLDEAVGHPDLEANTAMLAQVRAELRQRGPEGGADAREDE